LKIYTFVVDMFFAFKLLTILLGIHRSAVTAKEK